MDLNLYYDRWIALDTLIDQTQTYYDSRDPAFPRKEVIGHLLSRLRAFAAGQFQFFYYGFQSPDTKNEQPGQDGYDPRLRLTSDAILQIWDEYPPADILTAIIEQTSHDLALIQRAADQRMSTSARMIDALNNADSLATLALQPAIDNKLIDQPTTVLTYFEKAAEFYNIPYAKVALISVPFTCASVKQDYLALPHEAGHYVYRNLKPEAKTALLDLRLRPTVSPPYQDWARTVFEELSADIYGCLVGGPAMVLDFQNMCLANSQAKFTGSDGNHPNPVLRPLIYCQVLDSDLMKAVAEAREDYSALSEQLAADWSDELRQRHANTFTITATSTLANFGGGDQGYTVKEAIIPVISNAISKERGPIGDIVSGVVDSLFTHIKQYVGKEALVRRPTWSWTYDGGIPADYAGLSAAFENNFDSLVNEYLNDGTLKNPVLTPVEPKRIGEDWVRRPASWLQWLQQDHRLNPEYQKGQDDPVDLRKVASMPQAWPAEWPVGRPMPSGEVRNPDRMEPGTWGYILYANGWATGGPSDNSSGHPAT